MKNGGELIAEFSEQNPPPGPLQEGLTEVVEVCPSCGSCNWEFLLWGKSRYNKFWHPYSKCLKCDLVLIRPRCGSDAVEEKVHKTGSSISKFVTESHFEKLDFEQNIISPVKKILKPEDNDLSKLHWLDIGCALGGLLETVSEHGFETTGLELNQAHVNWIQKNRPNINISLGRFHDLPKNQKYDIISADNVFEHIPNPEPFLQEAKSKLNTGGLLLIRVPNYNTIFRYYYSLRKSLPKSYIIDPDAHPYNYQIKTLSNTIKRQGFKIISSSHKLEFTYPLRHILKKKVDHQNPSSIKRAKAFQKTMSIFDGLIPFGGIDVTVIATID